MFLVLLFFFLTLYAEHKERIKQVEEEERLKKEKEEERQRVAEIKSNEQKKLSDEYLQDLTEETQDKLERTSQVNLIVELICFVS